MNKAQPEAKPPKARPMSEAHQAPNPTTPTYPALTLLSPLSPPSSTRAWLSAPHPTLPLIATCSSDRCVRIYSLKTFNLHSTIEGGHKRSIRSCAWKPSAHRLQVDNTEGQGGEDRYRTGTETELVLATGSFDSTAGIWKYTYPSLETGDGSERGLDQGEEDKEWRFSIILEGHDSEIKSVAWSSHGNLLATCSRDKSVWIWEDLSSTPSYANTNSHFPLDAVEDEDTFETVAVLQEHDADVKYVTWHPKEDLIASAGYDETIRFWREDADGMGGDDWGCVGVIEAGENSDVGHRGTIWAVEFEPADLPGLASLSSSLCPPSTTSSPRISPEQEETAHTNGDPSAQHPSPATSTLNRKRHAHLTELRSSGPRLISCSDDLTIRIWRRKPKAPRPSNSDGKKYPSIIKPSAADEREDWIQEAVLPPRHDRAIYSVGWSKISGRVVSAGGDGRVVVYEERWVGDTSAGERAGEGEEQREGVAEDVEMEDVVPRDGDPTSHATTDLGGDEVAQSKARDAMAEQPPGDEVDEAPRADQTQTEGEQSRPHQPLTHWVIIAEQEAAHGAFEIDHVCWAKRFDRGRRREAEEVVVTTGDDGVVNLWTLDV